MVDLSSLQPIIKWNIYRLRHEFLEVVGLFAVEDFLQQFFLDLDHEEDDQKEAVVEVVLSGVRDFFRVF